MFGGVVTGYAIACSFTSECPGAVLGLLLDQISASSSKQPAPVTARLS